MAQLVQSFSGDTALRLQDEEFTRQFSFGHNWKRLRVAVLQSIPGLGTASVAGINYYIGACQGTTTGFKSTSCVEWVGINYTAGSAVYAAGPPETIALGDPSPRVTRKVGAVQTNEVDANSNCLISKTSRSYFLVDIVVVSGGYQVSHAGPAPTVADISQSDFRMYASQETAFTALATTTFVSNYQLDSVSIYWAYAPIGLEISEILAIRFH